MTGPELYRLDDRTLAQHLRDLGEPELREAMKLLQLEDDAAKARLERPEALHQAARYYASKLGWAVFPCKPGLKTPATHNGFKDATTDLDLIDSWWKRNPACNIGLPTGQLFDVLDIDAPAGFHSLADWREENPDIVNGLLNSALAVALTGNSGRHYLLPPTGNGNAAGLRPGIDYRGVGGYIVAPPSKTDRRYTWIDAPRAAA